MSKSTETVIEIELMANLLDLVDKEFKTTFLKMLRELGIWIMSRK